MNRAPNVLGRLLAAASCLLLILALAGCQGETPPKETTTVPAPGPSQPHPAGATVNPTAPGANQPH